MNLKTSELLKFDIVALDERKTQLYKIYILMFSAIDELDHEWFFKEAFLVINMKDDVLLSMSWLV